MGITVKMSFLKEKASRKLANGQNIDYSEKENGPRASSAPALGLNTIIFKHVYWYMLQISGERLQDHWSSGLKVFLSHLLIAGCISVRPFVRPSVRQHLRRSLVFSTSEIAASLKPCIVIVPDIPFKHAP